MSNILHGKGAVINQNGIGKIGQSFVLADPEKNMSCTATCCIASVPAYLGNIVHGKRAIGRDEWSASNQNGIGKNWRSFVIADPEKS